MFEKVLNTLVLFFLRLHDCILQLLTLPKSSFYVYLKVKSLFYRPFLWHAFNAKTF